MGIGDWGLGIGDWGLGPIPNPQSPIPNCIILINKQKNIRKKILILFNLKYKFIYSIFIFYHSYLKNASWI